MGGFRPNLPKNRFARFCNVFLLPQGRLTSSNDSSSHSANCGKTTVLHSTDDFGTGLVHRQGNLLGHELFDFPEHLLARGLRFVASVQEGLHDRAPSSLYR
jgi:hypothetical protein